MHALNTKKMAASVEITTTQNVTIEYELARLRDRIAAFALDLIIILFGYFVLFFAIMSIFEHSIGQWWGIFMSIAAIAGYFLYHIVSEIAFNGQTLGKRVTNCKVVRLDGKEPQWSDVVLRAMLQMIDIFTTLGIIGVILIKTTPRMQRLGDMAANTAVIQLRSNFTRFTLGEILNIATATNYQPQYPQVRALTEKDMMLIKSVLSRYQKYPNEAHALAVDTLSDRLMELLEVKTIPFSRTDFLKTLLRDYIVLTR